MKETSGLVNSSSSVEVILLFQSLVFLMVYSHIMLLSLLPQETQLGVRAQGEMSQPIQEGRYRLGTLNTSQEL